MPASLAPRQERVLRMCFGLGMNTDHTLKEVGWTSIAEMGEHWTSLL